MKSTSVLEAIMISLIPSFGRQTAEFDAGLEYISRYDTLIPRSNV